MIGSNQLSGIRNGTRKHGYSQQIPVCCNHPNRRFEFYFPPQTLSRTKGMRLLPEASLRIPSRIRPMPSPPLSSTAIPTSVLPAAPRPRLPGFFPPIKLSSTSTTPDNLSRTGKTAWPSQAIKIVPASMFKGV